MGWWSKLIRWALVTKAGADTGQFPVQQVTYLGKAADATMVFPYGMHANVDGDSIGPLLVLGGNLENRAMIPTSMTRRSRLASGDVEVYSPVSRSRVTFRANGSVEVVGTDVTVTASGVLTATAATASITAATVTITGNVVITGGLSVSGAMTNAGKDVGATHGHVQANDSGGSTEAPISGVT